MGELTCLVFVLLCFGATIGFMVFNVWVRGRRLRRTANDDLRLLQERSEAKLPTLASTINGLITIESAFASVTVAVLFVVVGIIISGTVTLPEIIAPITFTAITGLGIATICWILSLEMLSHLISPSLADESFGPVYQEALNLWNIGLMLLLLSISLVLIPVNTGVAASVALVTTILSWRTLTLVHQWGRVTLKSMEVVKPIKSAENGSKPNPWLFSFGLATVAIILAPLYFPLNRPTEVVRFLGTAVDDIIPLWPVFVLPYLSYFVYILWASSTVLLRRDRETFDRLVLAIIIIFAVSYLFYGFFQTGMHRPNLVGESGWLVDLVARIYGSDNPYNAFPSSHASLTTACCLALWRSRSVRWPAVVWAVLIVASTVLVKQHYAADALAGVTLGGVSFWLASRFLAARA